MEKDAQKSKLTSLDIPALTGGRSGIGLSPAPSRVSVLGRWMAHKLLDLLGDPPLTFVLWNGEKIPSVDKPSIARVHFRDSEVLQKLLVNPALHFGDLYSAGRIEVEGNLVDFLVTVYRAAAASPKFQKLKQAQTRLFNRPRPNELTDSRDNIHHHYDIGNDFYELWLDREAMQYTCAYFPTPDLSLEEAQRAKMDHICRKLRLKPGDRVVEAGCGWGGFAHHMAKHYGVEVRSYNISRQQILYARERAEAAGLEGKVDYVEDDYRNITGEFDVFVSVGMLEHVGREHYQELGDIIHRCLTPTGRGLIHSIGRNKPEPMNAWIEKRIFPGSYPPTLREIMEIFEAHEFSVLDVENLRLHYAKTLEHWLERFNRHAEKIEKSYDRAFVRAWRLYLAGSIAGFTAGTLQLFQVVFTRGDNNDLPWSRAHLYRET
ncbi:MAG: cyclopropane-fatty-acyl-phospholipid synthase [Candidatus Muproteobacteria bacterium RIFCSPHIGHO2_12_FULL_60_33]|uniref:Cyclopropane-fatty-acyl-phospholipid synthase n=1 Tax=Candidatus Muproteobacteria bacterium RIFCSPLOWO2_01_FULL_60_18 TaxID=1817768 RepID=A0A1F6TY34_9PROT|nr:MAG: cyclopropane-fatty-acyl-phospholipid synthase [Candidatus Muproteobacteria bacterium RIFCSPHIGHO2_01_60_12]OGI50006.1 MAG: cyclopropane-fatty-acyl-phospholipid synthase [Candidatus Muproteobacteria bacterium RIFCSPLOWO2_01_FULL_60_18]OGI54345.1 MAG: cyclopropane-fatty-acyl-phospholipid synthase [Candidatus Muproteobacteria bacterium RIFCSPHIGHO2_12_FULL_60_33]OGI59325.1 MAG: cyclopropane-fatty-acyl-phospholipid synthase [Candidatus Muproteobacteria bacterium RIFCSPHIGHO2_01_FULL_61_200]